MDDRTETGLALDDNVGDTHLAAESGEEDNELDGVDVVGDQDERGLLVLDEADNVVETELGGVGLLGDILLLLALGDGGSLLGQALLLLDLGLRAVLVEELERLGGDCNALAMMRLDIPCMCVLTVAVSNVLELGNRRGDLQTEVEDLLLALKTDVGGPPDHAAKVALGLDVLADAIVLGALLDDLWRMQEAEGQDPLAANPLPSSVLSKASLSLGEGGGGGLLSLRRHFEL